MKVRLPAVMVPVTAAPEPDFADIGGFAMEDASDTTVQDRAGLGDRSNERRAEQSGYRHLAIERGLRGWGIRLDPNGPMTGDRTFS